ncbi:MAG: ATP-binding cassette domain-containing protein [Methanomassiliicoccales archaeon]|nr:ATP-binding cassette domain-containing protein [Methanomassiliicoccales archaeon]
MNEEKILEIRDLYVNFYTKSGVVKALDGISFSIAKGETFGLVGESGCGKTVTANCVLRLIAEPPGKMESGSIIFSPDLKGIETRIATLEVEKIEDDHELSYLRKRVEVLREQRAKEDSVKAKIADLEKAGGSAEDLAKAKEELLALESENDILKFDRAHLQKLRGKSISMIFQEPMSALNPVFTAADQISEVLLLHERSDLAKAVIREMDRRVKEIDSYHHRVSREKTVKGEFKCSNCGALMAEEVDCCPQCAGSFSSQPLRALEKWRLKFNRRYYVLMAKNPDSRRLRYAAKIPILRRYMHFAKEEAGARAERMLRLVRIPDPRNVMKSYPHELSGGMQQRVMIAMALACRPKLLIADEPTTALDVTVQAQILKLMRDLQLETGTSIMLITHNLGVVAETCDRVGVMYAGTMAEIASTMDIFKDPLHPYTQGLMHLIPKINVDIERLETIEGVVPNLMEPPPGCRFHPRCSYAMEACKRIKPIMREVRPGHFAACHLFEGAK